jgi:hypothetical protein
VPALRVVGQIAVVIAQLARAFAFEALLVAFKGFPETVVLLGR